MIYFIAYIILPIFLLNLVDQPVEIKSDKDQIFVIISGVSCHECLEKLDDWFSKSNLEITVVIWYQKTIIQKKKQIKFYKNYISPTNWLFSKDLEKLANEFELEHSPNVIVIKNEKTYYFKYLDLFSNKSRVDELIKLIKK